MISFCGHWSVSLWEERVRGGPGRPARPPARPRGLTGSRPGSRRPGRGGSASASRWSQRRVCASVAGARVSLRRPGLPPTARAADRNLWGTPTHGAPTRTLTSCHSRTPLQASSLLLSRCSPTARPPRASPGEEGPMGPRAPNTRAPGCGRGTTEAGATTRAGCSPHTPRIHPNVQTQTPCPQG